MITKWDESDLRNLQNLDNTYLRPEFVNSLNALKNKIHRDCKQKHINGVGINMPMFMVFLEKFVNSFNDGKLPSISSAYAALIENEIFEHADSAKESFRVGLATSFGHAGPMERADLYFKVNELRDRAFEILNDCYMVGERNEEVFERYKLDLIEYMDIQEQRLYEKNAELSRSNNQNILYEQMNSFLESVDEIYEDDTKQSEDLIDSVSDQLDADFLNGYLQNKVGIQEEEILMDQIKVFSFQVLMGFKQNVRKIEIRKKNLKQRENQLEENQFMAKKMELDLIEKNFKRIKEEADDLDKDIKRIQEGGKNEQELVDLTQKVQANKKKMKQMDKDHESNKRVMQELQLNLEAKRKKSKRGCF